MQAAGPTVDNMYSVSSGAVWSKLSSMVTQHSVSQTIEARTLPNGDYVLIDIPIAANRFYVGGLFFAGLPTEDLTLNFNDYSGNFTNSINTNYTPNKILDVVGKAYQNTLHVFLQNYSGHSITLGDVLFIFNYLEFNI